MELKDTINLMVSDDYKKRFVAEYLQTKIRYEKLKTMFEKWEKGELDFKPDCPKFMYVMQLHHMEKYLLVLEMRAKKEEIELPKFEGTKDNTTTKNDEKEKKQDDEDCADLLRMLFILSMLG